MKTLIMTAVILTMTASASMADEVLDLTRYDLTSMSDAARLRHEIVTAAHKVCKVELAKSRSFVYGRRYRSAGLMLKCVKESTNRAIAEVQSGVQDSRLGEVHLSISKKSRYDKVKLP